MRCDGRWTGQKGDIGTGLRNLPALGTEFWSAADGFLSDGGQPTRTVGITAQRYGRRTAWSSCKLANARHARGSTAHTAPLGNNYDYQGDYYYCYYRLT